MTAGFQCWADEWGDVHVADGIVLQPRGDVLIRVGSGGGFGELRDGFTGGPLRMVPPAMSATFVGGSGRNVIATGVAPRYSGAACPAGFYRPAEPDTYRAGPFVLTVTGASAATISDGANVVAELTTGGTAPAGNYASTTYGTTTYGPLVGQTPQAFTIAVAAESASPSDPPQAFSSVSGGAGPAGEWTPTNSATYTLDADADFTLVIESDGSAEIRHLTTAIAARATGSAWHPGGTYEATTAGLALNDGQPWRAAVSLIPSATRSGTVYLEMVETGGVLTAVNGPFFGALPTASGGSFFYPLAEFDGMGGSEQFHTGPIHWPPPGGSGGAPDITTRNMAILGL